MIRIWEGDVTKIWGAIQFCRIIDNLFFWAQQCLKPKVTQYLSQWILRYCPDSPNVNSRLEKDVTTADMVHRIQDRLSSLGIPPNNDTKTLVQQAVILQEAWAISKEKHQLNSRADEEKKDAEPISLTKHYKKRDVEVTPSHQKQDERGIEQTGRLESQEKQDENRNSTSTTNLSSKFQSSQPLPQSSSKSETTVVTTLEKSGESGKEGSAAAVELRGKCCQLSVFLNGTTTDILQLYSRSPSQLKLPRALKSLLFPKQEKKAPEIHQLW
jgi:hypothetical protein